MFKTVKQAREYLTAQGFYVRAHRWYDIDSKVSGQGYVVSNFRGGICYNGVFNHKGKDHFLSWVNHYYKPVLGQFVASSDELAF